MHRRSEGRKLECLMTSLSFSTDLKGKNMKAEVVKEHLGNMQVTILILDGRGCLCIPYS